MITEEIKNKYNLTFIGENRFDIYNEEKEVMNLYINQKKSIREIMEIFKVSAKPIIKILKVNNIPRRIDASYFKKGNNLGSLNEKIEVHNHEEEVVRLYTQEYKNSREIAKIFNCGQSVICRILKENNILLEPTKIKIPTKWLIEEYNKGFSFRELGEKYNLKQSCIYLRLKRRGVKIRSIDYCTTAKIESKTKLRLFAEGKLKSHRKGKKHKPESIEKMKIWRATQILPLKDTKIEVKIQNFLIQLQIEFFTHYWMHIEHGYQCDIFIPGLNLIIECDGDFMHCNPKYYPEPNFIRFPKGRDKRTAKDLWKIDAIRTEELKEKGYRVIRLWECDIKQMDLNKFKEIIWMN